MSSPFGLGFGARFIFDAHQNWTGEGLPVYLRTQNANDEAQDFADTGFEVTVTSPNLLSGAGTTDHLVLPPPLVEPLSLVDIGIMGGKLMFGARKFTLSHTWVMAWMTANGYDNPLAVFEDPAKVVGLWHDNQLWAIKQVNHIDLGGAIIYWELMCDSAQQNISTGTGLDGP